MFKLNWYDQYLLSSRMSAFSQLNTGKLEDKIYHISTYEINSDVSLIYYDNDV